MTTLLEFNIKAKASSSVPSDKVYLHGFEYSFLQKYVGTGPVEMGLNRKAIFEKDDKGFYFYYVA